MCECETTSDLYYDTVIKLTKEAGKVSRCFMLIGRV